MKKLLIFVFIVFSIVGCNREEQNNNTIVTPPTTNSLTPLQTINLNPNITEPSGIFYNKFNSHLYIVSDSQPIVYECDLQGNVLNQLTISSTDLEGITFSANCDTFYVVEETKQLVTKYLSNGTKLYSFPVNVATNIKNSLEGITIDNENNLYVMNENTPKRLMKFVNNNLVWQIDLNYTTDLSDICYDSELDCFWIVSDESAKVVKMSKTGAFIKEWTLPFNKGEGIAFVGNKMYITNDGNGYMYIFNKPQ